MAFAKELMQSGLFFTQAQSIGGSIEAGITATGTTQATGYLLSKAVSLVTTAALNSGVVLPVSVTKADSLLVNNGGANPLTVYPSGTATINGAASVAVPVGKTALIFCTDGVNFISLIGA